MLRSNAKKRLGLSLRVKKLFVSLEVWDLIDQRPVGQTGGERGTCDGPGFSEIRVCGDGLRGVPAAQPSCS